MSTLADQVVEDYGVSSRGSDQGPAQSMRKRRARTSCLPCRKHKIRCGCEPPQPCTRCRERGLSCTWPAEDRRTTRFRDGSARLSGATPHEDEIPETTASASNLDPMMAQWDDAPLTANINVASRIEATTNLDNRWLQTLFGTDILPAFSLADWDMPLSHETTTYPSGVDFAMPGDLPIVEPSLAAEARTNGAVSRMITVRWSRPHGPTAYAPGFHFMGVNLVVQDQVTFQAADSPASVGPAMLGHFRQETLLGLVDVFDVHFGAQFPCIDSIKIREQIHRGSGSQFLLYCLCGLAARFSEDPDIALPGLQPSRYGDVFNEKARAMVGLVLSVPLLETIMGFLLLTLGINGKGAASELWMLSGLAARMSLDMGLHLASRDTTGIDPSDVATRKRLTFWSVFGLDLMVAMGLGRTTTISPTCIAQPLPEQDCLPHRGPLHPFPYFAKVMLEAAKINNRLNSQVDASRPDNLALLVDELFAWYQTLPLDLEWSHRNLAIHNEARQGHVMINLHLWLHTILVLSHSAASGGQSTGAQPGIDRESADVIREIVTACELLRPEPFLDLPLICQPLYCAAMVYLDMLSSDSAEMSGTSMTASRLRSHISCLQTTFVALDRYWLGTQSIAALLNQRLRGRANADFSDADESRASVEVMPWLLPDRYST